MNTYRYVSHSNTWTHTGMSATWTHTGMSATLFTPSVASLLLVMLRLWFVSTEHSQRLGQILVMSAVVSGTPQHRKQLERSALSNVNEDRVPKPCQWWDWLELMSYSCSWLHPYSNCLSDCRSTVIVRATYCSLFVLVSHFLSFCIGEMHLLQQFSCDSEVYCTSYATNALIKKLVHYAYTNIQ